MRRELVPLAAPAGAADPGGAGWTARASCPSIATTRFHYRHTIVCQRADAKMSASFRLTGLNEPAAALAPAGALSANSADAADLVAQIGIEVADALQPALERVVALAETGKIDRAGLRALREEIERARRIGLMGPQVSRLSSGRVHLEPERVDLPAILREGLAQRAREIAVRGLEVRQSTAAASVVVDATLLFTLLQALFDWSFEHASARVDLHVALKGWPEQVHLVCSFECAAARQGDGRAHEAGPGSLETMSWRLLETSARALGLGFERHDTLGRTLLDIQFPAAGPDLEEADTLLDLELDARPSSGHNSKPLAGSHVLMVVARRDVRALVREALRHMGLMLDFVSSVEEARQFCLGGLPHAIVYEAPLGGARMQRLRAELVIEAPNLAFIEIAEEGHAFETTHVDGKVHARVSRTSLTEALPAALTFELSRTG